MVWGIVASAAMIFMPAAESAGGIARTVKNVATGNKTVRHDDDLDTSAHNDTTHDGKKVAEKMVKGETDGAEKV